MSKPTERQITERAAQLLRLHPELDQTTAIRNAFCELTGMDAALPQSAREVVVKPPADPVAGSARKVQRRMQGKRNLEDKLRSVGIVDVRGKPKRSLMQNAIGAIENQLKNPHVGLARREYLLKLLREFRTQAHATRRQVCSGGLPSLGKRR